MTVKRVVILALQIIKMQYSSKQSTQPVFTITPRHTRETKPDVRVRNAGLRTRHWRQNTRDVAVPRLHYSRSLAKKWSICARIPMRQTQLGKPTNQVTRLIQRLGDVFTDSEISIKKNAWPDRTHYTSKGC